VLRLRMSSLFVGAVEFGTAAFYLLDRESLRRGPDGHLIARHERHSWQVGEQHFSSIEIEGDAMFAVFFDERNTSLARRIVGPFRSLRFADGCGYVDDQRIADFEETSRLWCQPPTDTCWPIIEIRSDRGVPN
jgi:hypothetical protein